MGFLDTLFSPGEIEEQGKVESQTNFPQWYNRLNQANLLRATETAFEPYQAYQGPRQALSDPDQIAARQGIKDTSGIASPFFTEAFNQSKLGSTQLAGTDIRPFMSPFQQGVTDIALREARRQGDIQRNQLDSQATRAGAFGGSRAALEQAEAERNIQQNLGDIQATGSQRAYDSALAQLGLDRAAASQSAPQMAALGTGLQTVTTSGLKEAELASERNRAERQGALDIGYQDFLTQRQYPMAQASGLQSLLTGASVPGSSLQTTFGQPPSVGGQIGGMAMAGLGALGSGGAFEPGGFITSLVSKDGGEIKMKRGYANGDEVNIGRPDPDDLFGRPGVMSSARERVLSEAAALEAAALQEAMTEEEEFQRRVREEGILASSPENRNMYNFPPNLRWMDVALYEGSSQAPSPAVLQDLLDRGVITPDPYRNTRAYDDYQRALEGVPAARAAAPEQIAAEREALIDSGSPRSNSDAGMSPLLAAAMAGDPEDSVVDPDPVTSDPDPDTSDSGSGGFDYDLLLELGLGMMAAGAVPGSTVAGSLGQGGLSALQARREADALRRKEAMESRQLDIIERANEQDFNTAFASLSQDQRQEVIDLMASRQSDLLEALTEPTLVGSAREKAQKEYDNLTFAIDNIIYPDDLLSMAAGLDE
jgi:hypothetical protein